MVLFHGLIKMILLPLLSGEHNYTRLSLYADNFLIFQQMLNYCNSELAIDNCTLATCNFELLFLYL